MDNSKKKFFLSIQLNILRIHLSFRILRVEKHM